jgi:hypothetical protein
MRGVGAGAQETRHSQLVRHVAACGVHAISTSYAASRHRRAGVAIGSRTERIRDWHVWSNNPTQPSEYLVSQLLKYGWKETLFEGLQNIRNNGTHQENGTDRKHSKMKGPRQEERRKKRAQNTQIDEEIAWAKRNKRHARKRLGSGWRAEERECQNTSNTRQIHGNSPRLNTKTPELGCCLGWKRPTMPRFVIIQY